MAIGVKWRYDAPHHYPLSNDGSRHDFLTIIGVFGCLSKTTSFESKSTRKVFHGKPSDFMLSQANQNALAQMAAFDVEVRPSQVDGAPSCTASFLLEAADTPWPATGGIEFVAKPSLFGTKLE